MTWEPISKEDLRELLNVSFTKEQKQLWDSIRIVPEKWKEDVHGAEGNGFWVVGIYNKNVIWYNDIEEGFNISPYTTLGKIDEYGCEQDELNWALDKLIKINTD